MAALFPSLISANLLNLETEIHTLDPYVAGYHLDVMDFHFVPNLTWGPSFINAIRTATKKPLFVHLMVDYPEKYFDRFKLHQDDIVAIHYESPSAYTHEQLLQSICSRGWIASLALNPATPLDALHPLKNHLQNVLLMSVEPGFSGQTFIPDSLEKLSTLAAWRRENNLSFTISIDGGINEANSSELISRGADQLAVASAIFSHTDRIRAIKNILRNY